MLYLEICLIGLSRESKLGRDVYHRVSPVPQIGGSTEASWWKRANDEVGIVIITSPPFLVLGRMGVRCCAMCMWWWWWWCSTNELLTRDYTHTERRVINKHTHPSTPGDSHKKLGGYSIPYISRLSFSSSSNNLSAIIKRRGALEGANVKYLRLLLGLIFPSVKFFCFFEEGMR